MATAQGLHMAFHQAEDKVVNGTVTDAAVPISIKASTLCQLALRAMSLMPSI
jgi:hypothetical protein